MRLSESRIARHLYPSRSDNKKPPPEVLHAHDKKDQCEHLYAQGRITDAANTLIEITNTTSEVVRADKSLADWLTGEFHFRPHQKGAFNSYHQSLHTDVYRS